MNNQLKAQSLNRKSCRKFTLSYFSVTCYKHVELLWPISALDRKQVRGYAPSHHLNQCWYIVIWTLRNKLPWNFNRNSYIFIARKIVWKCLLENNKPFCLGLNVLMPNLWMTWHAICKGFESLNVISVPEITNIGYRLQWVNRKIRLIGSRS